MLKLPVLCHFCHHNATRNRLIVSDCCKGGIVATKINFIEVNVVLSRAEPQSRKSFSLRFWLRMISGELQRAVVCTKLHPNASLSSPLFGPKKSGKWPEEEWKVTQRRLESGLKKVGKWPEEGRKVAQRRIRLSWVKF